MRRGCKAGPGGIARVNSARKRKRFVCSVKSAGVISFFKYRGGSKSGRYKQISESLTDLNGSRCI